MATIGTFTAGQILTASELNNAVPLCILENSAFVLASGSVSQVTFSTEVLDPLNWHSTTTNTTRITPTIAGYYFVTMQVNDIVGASSTRALMGLLKNNAPLTIPIQMDTSGTDDDFAVPGYVYCNGTTDYIEMRVLQTNSGATSRTIGARFTAQFIHP